MTFFRRNNEFDYFRRFAYEFLVVRDQGTFPKFSIRPG